MRPRIPLAWIDQATTRSFTSEMLAIIGPLIPRLSHVTTTRNRFSFEGKRSAPPTVSEEEESCRSARPMPLHMNRLKAPAIEVFADVHVASAVRGQRVRNVQRSAEN